MKNVEVWKYLSIVRVVFSVLAWLLFSLFISSDETLSSLEKRDYSLIDEIVENANNSNQRHSRSSHRPQEPGSQKSLRN